MAWVGLGIADFIRHRYQPHTSAGSLSQDSYCQRRRRSVPTVRLSGRGDTTFGGHPAPENTVIESGLADGSTTSPGRVTGWLACREE